MTLARFRFSVVLLLAPLAGCETRARQVSPPASTAHAQPAAAPADDSKPAEGEPPAAKPKTFGAPINGGAGRPLADVLASPERFRDQTLIIEGHVRSACTRRGCWMELAETGDPKMPGCRVTFKDYGFFVPTDSAGARAKVQGVLGVNTLPAERVAHLESEGGNFPRKNADGSVDELRLVATGVELWRL